MKREPLWQISVVTTPDAEDAVAELLGAVLGQPAVSGFDNKTGRSTVTVYFQQKPNLSREVREAISTGLKRIGRCGLRVGSGKIVVARIRQEDWAESWKQHFKPIKIGNELLIKPSWSKCRPRKRQSVVVLDPGLSFGTGHHPTTVFCLKEIVRLEKDRDCAPRCPDGSVGRPCLKPRSLLDLGTGSGILAIAAAKLGYSPVLAMDFDPEAIRVARANAHVNRVHRKLKIRLEDVKKLPMCPGQRGQKYDLVCANLISQLLITERRRIAAQLARSGTLILTGILQPEFAAVCQAYEALGLKPVCRRAEKEWCSGSFRFGR